MRKFKIAFPYREGVYVSEIITLIKEKKTCQTRSGEHLLINEDTMPRWKIPSTVVRPIETGVQISIHTDCEIH